MANDKTPRKSTVKPGYRRMTYEMSEQALAKIKKIGTALDFPNSDIVDAAILTLDVNNTTFRQKVAQIKSERAAQRETMSELRKEVMSMSEEELAALLAKAKA